MALRRRPPYQLLFIAVALAALGALLAAGAAAGETEPNDNEATAEPWTLDSVATGSVSTYDRDMYALNLTDPGLLTVWVEGTNLYVYVLRSSDGVNVGSPQQPGAVSGTFTVGAVIDSPQRYYVSLWSYSTQPTNYSFDASEVLSFSRIEGLNETEPNGDPANATALPVGAAVSGRTDAAFSSDVDYWTVAGVGEGLFELHAASLQYSEVSILHPGDLTHLATRNSQSGFDTYYRALLPASTDTLIVAVRSDRSLNYTLTVTFDAGLSRLQGPDEVELNDDPGTATHVALNGSYRGRIVSDFGDQDYWSFDVPGPGSVLFTVNRTDVRVAITEAWGGQAPVMGSLYGSFGVSYGWVSPGNASYLVLVSYPYASAEPAYLLTVAYDPGYGPMRGGTEVEPNGEQATATPTNASRTASGKLARAFADEDWWRLDVPGPGLLTVTLTSCCAGTLGADLIVGGDPGVFAQLQLCGPTCTPSRTLTWSSPGTLYIRLDTSDSVDVDYSLVLSFDTGFGATAGPDETEPNNNMSTAQALTPGVPVRAKLNTSMFDVDFFVVHVPNDATLAVAINSDQVDSFQVTRQPPNSPLNQGLSPTYGTIWFRDVQAGDVVVQVTQGTPVANYTITVWLVSSEAELFALPGEVEPNQSPAGAAVVRPWVPYEGAVGWYGDPADYLAVEGNPGDLVEVSIGTLQGGPYTLTIPSWDTPAGQTPGAPGYYTPSLPMRFLFHGSGRVEFALASSYPTVYRVSVTSTHLPLYAEGRETVAELAGAPEVGLEVAPSAWSARSSQHLDLQSGLYGGLVCLSHTLTASLDNVFLPAGQIFTVPGGGQVVAVGASGFRIWAQNSTCVPSLAYTPAMWGAPPAALSFGEMAPASVVSLLQVIGVHKAWSPAGVLALWAVTGTVGDSEVSRWMVTNAEAVYANQLLQEAGLSQRVPVPAVASPSTTGGAGGTTGGGLSLPGGAVVLLSGLGSLSALAVGVPFLIGALRVGAEDRPRAARPRPPAGQARVPARPPAATAPAAAPPPTAGPSPPPGAWRASPGVPNCVRCSAPYQVGYVHCPRCRWPY